MALLGSTLAKREEEEVAREENFGDGRKGKKGKGGGDGGYHSKIQAKQMADIIRVEEQAAEQARKDFRMSEHDRTPVPVVKGETLSALEKAKEAARQKALEEFRAGERDRTRVPAPALGGGKLATLAKDNGNGDSKGVVLPHLTPALYASLTNLNTAMQVNVYGLTTGIGISVGALVGFLIALGSGAGMLVGPSAVFTSAIIGSIGGAMWGTYESSCISAFQNELDAAYTQGVGVEISRHPVFGYYIYSGGETVSLANGPLSALYVSGVTYFLTHQIP